MRLLLAVAATSLIVSSPAIAQVGTASCTFRLTSGGSAPPSVIGPDWFIPLVYVENQADSPLEFVSIDFNKTDLDVTPAGFRKKEDYVLRVRNRSDRAILRFDVSVRMIPAAHLPQSPFGFLSRSGFAPKRGPIGPGETIAIRYQGGGGRGYDNDPHRNGADYRVVLTVEAIEFHDCYYQPSIVVPKVLR